MVQGVQLQQNLVHLWVLGNQALLALLEIQVYLADLVDPSAPTVLGEEQNQFNDLFGFCLLV